MKQTPGYCLWHSRSKFEIEQLLCWSRDLL